MKYFLILGIVLLSLSGCWPCPDPVWVDKSYIPDSILALNPYEDGGNYSFRHSSGSMIYYTASRQVKDRFWDQSGAEQCSDTIFIFQENTTSLRSNYPVFDMGIRISNFIDDFCSYSVVVGTDHFQIPIFKGYPDEYEDSILMDNIWYQQIFLFETDSDRSNDIVHLDSLYYSLESGILKILMSNGEYYKLSE